MNIFVYVFWQTYTQIAFGYKNLEIELLGHIKTTY